MAEGVLVKILCVGVNHRSAPLEWRQRLAFDRDSATRALAILKTRFESAEFVILSTCNRVEVYCAAPAEEPPEADDLVVALAEFHKVPAAELAALAYRLPMGEAVRHLLEVASSLDSLVVGEREITGQVKEAYLWAVECEATGKFLNRLFHRAFHAARRVRAATELGRQGASVASAAVELAARRPGGLDGKSVLVIGAGRMAERAVAHLAACPAREITIVNRTAGRAAALAATFAATARPWAELDQCLAVSDVVIAATAGAEPILTRGVLEAIHRQRGGREWLILDLGVPRGVEAEAGRLPGVQLCDVDGLVGAAAGPEASIPARRDAPGWAGQQDLDLAMDIVEDEARAYLDWLEVRDAGPLVEKLEAKLHDLGDEELERLLRRLPPSVDEAARSEIGLATHRIVHKLLHEPIARLKEEAREGRAHMSMRVLRRLFGLGGEHEE